MKKLLLLLLFASIATTLAQTNVYNYGFNGTTANMTTAGWTRTNQSTVTPPTLASTVLWTVSTITARTVNTAANPPVRNNPFNDVVVANGQTTPVPNGHLGGANSFALVNFLSTSSTLATGAIISNWLITPIITVENGDVISFYSRLGKIPGSTGAGFPDRLQLRMSLDGAFSIDPSTGPADVGTYTNLLVDINPTLITGVYPQVWTQYSYTVEGLSAPTDVKIGFRYFVEDGGANGPKSDIVGIDTFSVDRPALLTNSFFTENFKIYPNPVNNILNIANNKNHEILALEITDINGRVVIKTTNNGTSIDTNDLKTGVYFIKINTAEGSGTSKFVKL